MKKKLDKLRLENSSDQSIQVAYINTRCENTLGGFAFFEVKTVRNVMRLGKTGKNVSGMARFFSNVCDKMKHIIILLTIVPRRSTYSLLK